MKISQEEKSAILYMMEQIDASYAERGEKHGEDESRWKEAWDAINKLMEPTTVVVVLDGGLVQCVESSNGEVEVIVVDREIEIFDPENDTTYISENGNEVEAHIHVEIAEETQWAKDMAEKFSE